MATLVLTAIGADRTGLVGALADVVADHGGNWERSQMAELAGQFAGIVLVSVPDQRADELIAALDEIEGLLDVTVHRGADEVVAGRSVTLQLLGGDRPGIVREISHVLGSLGISIDQLTTATRDAPMAGGVLFEVAAVLEVPDDVPDDRLRVALEAVANELMVDIDLDHYHIGS